MYFDPSVSAKTCIPARKHSIMYDLLYVNDVAVIENTVKFRIKKKKIFEVSIKSYLLCAFESGERT